MKLNATIHSFNLKSVFQEADQYVPALEDRLPRIGISMNRKEGQACLAEDYYLSVLRAGGAPVLIPALTDLSALTVLVEDLDGLIFTGGGDINPLFVSEEPVPALGEGDTFRDLYELRLLRLAFNRQIPLMGICRGHQLFSVAFGGSIYQDLVSQAGIPVIQHSQKQPRPYPSHTITLRNTNTGLQSIFGNTDTLAVNSFHHQAVKELPPEFETTAIAPDGINEAMEHPYYPIFSVQWHPEAMTAGESPMLDLFRYHIKKAVTFRKAKELHRRILTLDSHTDTPMVFPGHFDLGKKEGGKVNLPFMEEGLIDAAFMVAYIPQGKRDNDSLRKATDYAVERLTEVRRQELINGKRMGIATTPDDLRRLKREGKKAIFLGIENGYALGKELANVERFKKMGVSYITLCHNGDNDLCDSAAGTNEWGGLSPYGREVVAEMNRLGIMVDVSHAADSTFFDALKTSRVPIIASHSSARALTDHRRNLTDEQLKALAAQGGVVQVCLYKEFVNTDADKASIDDAIRHIDHIVHLIGIDHVGVGSDFDGDGELIGCRASNELINITVKLLEKGYREEDIAKLWGENLLRVMTAVQAAAESPA